MPPVGGEIPPRDGPSNETINVAVRDEEEIPLDLGRLPGIGLAGPGAADAIRAIAITLLARRTRDQAEVVLCGDEVGQLIAAGGGSVRPEVPGLVAFGDPGDGLDRLEAEIIHRRRLLEASDGDEFDAYRDANPDEPTAHGPGDRARRHAARSAPGGPAGPQPAPRDRRGPGRGLALRGHLPGRRQRDGHQRDRARVARP
jgi:hypothetical protein